MYVVYGCEHLRDGLEEWAKILPTIEKAMEYINSDRFASRNHSYRLFELGEEVPIKQDTVEEQEKVVVKTHKVWKPVVDCSEPVSKRQLKEWNGTRT